jgi:poly(3-hydroxybutyrate) depolymerase
MLRAIVAAFAAVAMLAGLMLTTTTAADASHHPRTDRTNLSYTNPAGVTSTYHLYAAGLDWTKPVGLLVYADGSGEFGLKNPSSTYLLAGSNGLINVAKRHNMVLLTPLAPGAGCPDGGGTCWYQTSSGRTPTQKAQWSHDLVMKIKSDYHVNHNRMAIGGYSSGAQWTTQYYLPVHGRYAMGDGVAVAISYGGAPVTKVNTSLTLRQNVRVLWNVGSKDSAYTLPASSPYGVRGGKQWYDTRPWPAGTELKVINGLGHSRSDFGLVMDDAIRRHVPAR